MQKNTVKGVVRVNGSEVKREIERNAKEIQHMLWEFSERARLLAYAMDLLRRNREICRLVGVETDEPYAENLEHTIKEALEECHYFSCKLADSADEYVDAIMRSGVPMSPAFPDALENIIIKKQTEGDA